jgi:hypothetical protein
MIREIISSASTVLQLTMLFMLITLAIGLRGGGGRRSPKVSVFLLSQTLISTPAQNALGMFLASCVSLGIVRNSLLGYLRFLVDKFRVIYGT